MCTYAQRGLIVNRSLYLSVSQQLNLKITKKITKFLIIIIIIIIIIINNILTGGSNSLKWFSGRSLALKLNIIKILK